MCAQGKKPDETASILIKAGTENIRTSTSDETTSAAPIQTAILERWMEYEHALAMKLLGTTEAICEWEVLGQTARDVYVWAVCQINSLAIGTATSVPAVLSLENGGRIEGVQIPGDGTRYEIDIRQLFPPDLQEEILSTEVDTEAMWDHLQWRHKNPGPPLIVLSGGTLP